MAFDVNLTTPACPVKDRLRDQARQAVLAIPGVTDARVNMTAEVPAAGAEHLRAEERPEHRRVGSGKGGVGKSTVASNIAAARAKRRARDCSTPTSTVRASRS